MLALSVLDQSTIVSGRTPAASIAESLALARACDRLGYARYWVAEHHNSDSIAGTAPEVLMAAIAAKTTRIRVGSAGVMLPHYSALKVAEQFRVLEAIAPGRIDLGVGRAPGSDQRTAFALNPMADRASAQFPAQIRDLLAWLSGEALVEGHPFRDVRAQPAGPGMPEVWVLGSSDYGAQVAAHFGLRFCFAHFITDGHGAEAALDLYRAHFQPNERLTAPHAAVCVWAMAAETEAEAERQFATRALWRLGRDRGVYVPLPSPEEAANRAYTLAEQAHIARLRETALFGTADSVAGRLRALASGLGVEEVAVLTTMHSPAARLHSYELLAGAFGLGGGSVRAAA
jgi:luciferase family oxidoreductase group 1